MTSGVPYAEVIGDPVAHSKSPLIHGFWLAKLGLKGEYRATRVEEEGLAEFLALRRRDPDWLGGNVTIPHKVRILPLCDAVDPEAARIGAVNTLLARDGRIAAVNTDDVGFIDCLRPLSIGLSHVTLIGAGGAARAILSAFTTLGARSVSIVNRSEEKANALGEAFASVRSIVRLSPGLRLERSDLIVNATSLGMVGMPPLEVDLSEQSPSCVVTDIVYAPLETELLRQARDRRLRTIDGLGMLIGQAAAAFQLLFGEPAPREHDEELRKVLTA